MKGFTFKTLGVLAGGLLGPLALSAFDHPTGGFASALLANPAYMKAYVVAGYMAHNLYDHVFGGPPAK